MNRELSVEERKFQDEVRSFLRDEYTPDLRLASEGQVGMFADSELAIRWQRLLYDRGWVAPSWPKEYGGPGWTTIQRYIFDRECGLAGTPVLPAMGLQMCGPVLMGFGTDYQKSHFLPRILSGEHSWCQGYSEPGAGSDLASLKTRAVHEGSHYVVNGTKIWTTNAHTSNWMFFLARTKAAGRPQEGISFFLTPMDAPGIRVMPIISMSGEHEVNQVFLDDVSVPEMYRVGAENEGWTVAKYLLKFERGGGAAAGRLGTQLRRACTVARAELGENGQPLWNDPVVRARMAEIEAEIMAIEWTELRQLASRSTGQPVSDAEASLLKLVVSEAAQSISELALDLLGPRAAACQRDADGRFTTDTIIGPPHARLPTARYLNTRAVTIYGGSKEIQQNILAKILLGS